MAKKKKTKTAKRKLTKRKPAAKKKTYTHHPDHYNRSESFLVDGLEEDLKDAWFKIRELGASHGDQRIYASGRAIMFSRKVCYFFVRPKKKYLEVVIFLKDESFPDIFHSIKPVTKAKFAHTFKLIHSDQVEGDLAAALKDAYAQTPV